MRLGTRLLLVIAGITVTFLATDAYIAYNNATDRARAALLDKAEAVRGILMATRRVYHRVFTEGGLRLDEETLHLLPAYTLSRVSADFASWNASGLSFNNVSDRPRNPGNRADAVEMRALEQFRAEPTKEIIFEPFTDARASEPYYLYARPILIEPYCLECHGSRDAAPAVIRDTYSEAYDYQVGELRGILSIKIPAAEMQALVIDDFRTQFTVQVAGLGLAYVILALIIRRFVRNPLDRLATAMGMVAEGDYSPRLGAMPGELQVVGRTFDQMAEEIPRQHAQIAKLSAVVEQGPAGVVITDARGRIEYVNRRYANMVGSEPERMIGRNAFDWSAGRLDREEWQEFVATIKSGGIWHGEFRTEKADGRVVWEAATVTKLRISETGPPNMVAIIEDITARKADEDRLRRTVDELAASNAELERFAHLAAHDLQEPLRSVASYSQLLGRRYRGRLDSDADQFIDYMVGGVTRMQTLINDLIAYSRVRDKGQPFHLVDAAAAAEAAISNLQATIAESGGKVTCDPLPTVPGDAMQLVELFQNLIGNALKFRRAGTTPVVTVSADGHDGEWVFSITDNGIGIAPEYHERVFTIFERLHTQETYPGTGIGLAVCRRIVERHGGRIWVESEPGNGSVIRFTLPAAKEVALNTAAS